VQLGFVIDHSRCIGCHACTVACKSENDVPLGSFRTWVKYVDRGNYPQVRRSFSVLRCNQCSDAPCVTICPVAAMRKEKTGIVEVDPKACIGCMACMQGCPYNSIFINEELGIAEKCNFCAHRAEIGLAPACAVICPTEAIIPGDFDDPGSRVSQLKKEHRLDARKTEAGTRPNVFYIDVEPANIDPAKTNAATGFLWANRVQSPQIDAQTFEALESKAQGRPATAKTSYDVHHPARWGGLITAYLFGKSLAAGIFLVGAKPLYDILSTDSSRFAPLSLALAIPSLIMLALTMAALVGDLKKPSRFAYIMIRPNFSSWLARGSFILAGYGGLLSFWIAASFLEWTPSATLGRFLVLLTTIAAVLGACYTGWLFAQAKARVLWMRRGLWLHLIVQAVLAGSAFLLLFGGGMLASGLDPDIARSALMISLALHLSFTLTEGRFAPAGREHEYERAHHLVTSGPYARAHWILGITIGTLLPLLLLALNGPPALSMMAALFALIGLFVEEDILVRAGQALPIS